MWIAKRHVTLVSPENVHFCPWNLVSKLRRKQAVEGSRRVPTREGNGKTSIGLYGLVDCSDRRLGRAKAELIHISKYTYIGFHFATPLGF